MSDARTTGTRLRLAPAGVAPVSVATPASVYGYSAWVEFIASSAASVHVAGYVVGTTTSYSQKWIEVEIGVGAASAEVVVARDQIYGGTSSVANNRVRMLDAPVFCGVTGTRVAMRVRSNSAVSMPFTLTLLYYEALDTTAHVTEALLTAVPAGAVGTSVAVSGTAWAWSAWTQLTAGIANEIALCGLVTQNTVSGQLDYEFELGTGAASAEVAITRVRAPSSNSNVGTFRVHRLGAVLPLAPSTRVAVRVRKNGTSVVAVLVQLRYYDNTELL